MDNNAANAANNIAAGNNGEIGGIGADNNNAEADCFWSGHEICFAADAGRFYLYIYSSFRRPGDFLRNNTAGLDVFTRELLESDPVQLEFSSGHDEWNRLDASQWRLACHAAGQCPQLKSLKFYVPYCQEGTTDRTVKPLLEECQVKLEELEIADGLHGYEGTFQDLGKLKLLHTLSLKDMSHRVPLNNAVCIALASAIESLAVLRKFTLWNVRFENYADWLIVLEALKQKTELEEVDFQGLTACEGWTDPAVDFSEQIRGLRHFEDNRAAKQFLEHHGQRPYSMSDRVSALLHVRLMAQNGDDEQVRKLHLKERCQAPRPVWLHALHTLSDRLNFSYHLLRHESDPGAWAELRAASSIVAGTPTPATNTTKVGES